MSDAPYQSEVPEQLPAKPEASPPDAADTTDTTDAALGGARDAEGAAPVTAGSLVQARPRVPAAAALLTALMTLTFLMFLLIEPTQRWIALFGVAVAALGADGVLRSARREPFTIGLDTTPQLFLPAVYALALPVFIEHNARGLWAPLAGLAAGAGFGALLLAEIHSVRLYEERYATARTVAGAATYLAAFALLSLTYTFDLDLVPAIAAAAIVSGLLSIELLRDGVLDPFDTLLFAAVTAVIVGELRWSLHFVPLDGHLAALALLLGFFFTTSVLHAHLVRQLTRTALAEHVLVVALGLMLIVAARAADLA